MAMGDRPGAGLVNICQHIVREGRECVGAPTLVMQRGAVLVEDGELKAENGQGVFLPCAGH